MGGGGGGVKEKTKYIPMSKSEGPRSAVLQNRHLWEEIKVDKGSYNSHPAIARTWPIWGEKGKRGSYNVFLILLLVYLILRIS